MTKTLQDLIDDSIFISTEYQARLAELSGDAEWTVDFSAPSFTLQSDASVRLTPYLLGTESENRGSWIWSWQELGHFPDRVVSAAIQAREGGAQHSISELTTDELPLDSGLARKLTLATKALTGIYAHYPLTAGAGVRAWVLLDGPQLVLDAPTVNRMGQVMAQALQTGTAVNHLRAVNSYAKLRGAHIEWDTDATAVITAADGALRLWFDNGKISGIEPAEPQVGVDELTKLASQAEDIREQLESERQGIEAIAAREAAEQVAAREASRLATHEVEEEADAKEPEEVAELETQSPSDEQVEQEAKAPVAEDVPAVSDEPAEVAQSAESDEPAKADAPAEADKADKPTASDKPAKADAPAEADKADKPTTSDKPTTADAPQQTAGEDEVEGTVTTDRVYPNAGQPYDQEPTPDVQPGRVTTSAIADEDIVHEEPDAGAQEGRDKNQQAAEGRTSAEGEGRPSGDIRLAGQAPDLDGERAEAAKKPKGEKKGFFSRFFGL